MEEIVHYKFVDEKFTKYVQSLEKDEVLWFNEDPDVVPTDTINLVSRGVTITEDELKKTMSDNEEVNIFRSTIIVTENPTKGTISIKRYFLSKSLVPVKNLKRRKFKLIRREMFSLTINKTNGDYFVYKRSFKRKKQNTFIRKNITNANTRHAVLNLVDELDDNILRDSVSTFYKLLGYEANILTHRDLIFYFFQECAVVSAKKTSLLSFPFLNYARKNKIYIPNYYTSFIFEEMFKKDKAKYKNSSMSKYIADRLGIKNIQVIDRELFDLSYTNKRLDEFGNPNNNNQDPRFTFQNIDPLLLKIQDYYYSENTELRKTIGIKLSTIHDQTPSYFFDIIRMYNIGYDELMFNSDVCQTLIDSLYVFKQFGVKLRFNSLSDLRNGDIYTKIFYALCESRNKTGTFKVNNQFIKRINMYCPKNYSVSFAYRKPIRLGTYNDLFIDPNTLSVFVSFLPNNTKEINGGILFSKKKHNSSIRLKDSNHTFNNNIYTKLNEVLNYNKNGILDIMDIKQLYSREYFEDYCVKNFKIKPSIYIDYIN